MNSDPEATAVAITPGWLRSEMMLENFGVTETNWREALTERGGGRHQAPPNFALSEIATLSHGRASHQNEIAAGGIRSGWFPANSRAAYVFCGRLAARYLALHRRGP